MRIRLTLDHPPHQVLPINYNYLISSWIYRTLAKADQGFSKWLHEQGFGFQGRTYKLFTFGQLKPKRYEMHHQNATFSLAEGPTELEISFYLDEGLEHFILGLFDEQTFELKSGQFLARCQVRDMEVLPSPSFTNNMRFRCNSPICISQRAADQKYASYLSPEQQGYGELMVRNLLNKQSAFALQTEGVNNISAEVDFDFRFDLRSRPHSKLISVKGTKMRAYLFEFELQAPIELLKMGYFAGFGEKNSSAGMGLVSLKS